MAERVCIVETDRGRAGWSQMYCSRLGKMTMANTERFWRNDMQSVFAGVDRSEASRATCPHCIVKFRNYRAYRR